MQIMYINNDGGGFADHITINEGTTVGQLFDARVPNGDPGSYLIRVNRHPSTRDQQLQEGDRVSFTPTKIEGAADVSHTSKFRSRAHAWWLIVSSSIRKQVTKWRRNRTGV